MIMSLLLWLSTAFAAKDMECGWNGALVGGVCSCDTGWQGPECQQLDLLPVPIGSGLQQPLTSTWGGSIVHGDDGRLYMYASEMVGHCGIGSWSRNSKIVLASADNITATFAVEKDLWPVFSHEPTATRAPTGEYVVYFTTTAYGCGKDVPHCVPKCYCPNEQEHGCNPGGPTCFSECTGGITAPSCYDIDEDHRGRSAIRPYSTPLMVFNGSDRAVPFPANGSNPMVGATGDTNLAPVILADHSLVGIWRGSQYPNASQWQYRVSASDWRDPATYHFGTATRDNNIFPELAKLDGNEGGNCGIEDPSLWVDDAGVVHAIFHNYRAGGHAASPDNGATWHWYGGNCSQAAGRPSIDWSRSAWPKNITFRGDGSTTSSRQVHRRERPHILTERTTGKPIALSTGTQLDGPPHDVTFTMVQPVKTA